MKFTPIIDKNVVLHDTSKKMHVSFDDVDFNENSEEPNKKKKRSHPAHDDDNDNNTKVKKSKSDKKDKKKDKKDNKKDKKDKKEKKEKSKEESGKPVPVQSEQQLKPLITKTTTVEKKAAVPINVGQQQSKPTASNNVNTGKKKAAVAAVAITPGTPEKVVRRPKFTPKKVKAKPYTKPKKLTEEEVLAKVAAIRKKKSLKRQAKVKVDGEVINKPAFQIIPSGLSDKVIPTKQLGEFVLYALSETTNLPWCNIINKAKIEKLVMIYAQGLSSTYFGVPHNCTKIPPVVDLEGLKSEEWIGKASMPFLSKQSKYMISNEISGQNGRFNSPVADILQCNMSHSKKERLAKEQQERIALFKDNMREFYVLSLEELKKADFPIPPSLDSSVVLPEGWKETHPPLEPRKEGQLKRIIAVDCEMVMTTAGSALARITLIDEGKENLSGI